MYSENSVIFTYDKGLKHKDSNFDVGTYKNLNKIFWTCKTSYHVIRV